MAADSAVTTRQASAEIGVIVHDFPITHFICRTERILAQMPLLNKSLWLASLTSCALGMCVTDLHAQTTSGAPQKSASGSRGVKTATPQPSTTVPNTPPRTAGVPGTPPLNRRPAQVDPRKPLPPAAPMRIPKLSPEMEDILVEWEEKSAKIKRLEGTFVRTTYDKVFSVESVSQGRYCFQFPDQGSFLQVGVTKGAGMKGHRYIQKPGPTERWVCDGIKIIKIDEQAKEYESVVIPEEDRGQNIRNSPLPFLFGMKAVEAKQRYSFELNTEKTDANTIWMKVYPLHQLDLANYKKAEVILNRSNCLPQAVKLYDNSDNKEDVYVFDQKSMTINARTWGEFFTRTNPLKPDLTRYKRLITPENAVAPAGQQLATPPGGRRTTSLQPGGSKTLTTKPQIQRTAQVPDDDEPPARPAPTRRPKP